MEAVAAVAEERRADVAEQGDPAAVEDRMVMYKTKLVEFLGRSTPIILQNDNGPCPLLAICNVLSLRNAITLNPDVPEVSQDQLLTMVVDRLLESNSNVKSKDDGYVNNQQQNISDAIDLLPRLATGIDVNVHFRKINDFEFTRECAIFDLLDIGLYHGWIVDPEDKDTAKAVGSKSYNTVVGELVALETQHTEARRIPPEEDTVDFAAATAATLGIPSPSLSRGLSFDDPLPILPSEKVGRKGDLEEEADVMKALTLSRGELSTESTLSDISLSHESTYSNPSSDLEEGTTKKPDSSTSSKVLVGEMIGISEVIPSPDLLLSQDGNPSLCSKPETDSCGVPFEDATHTLKYGEENHLCPLTSQLSENVQACSTLDGNLLTTMQSMHVSAVVNDSNVLDADGTHTSLPEVASSDTRALAESIFGQSIYQKNGSSVVSGDLVSNIGTSFSGGIDSGDAHRSVCSSLEGGEPIYEGEECILDSGHLPYQNQEPVYEGEMVLAEQVDKMEADTAAQVDDGSSGKKYTGLTTISIEDGQLIRYFLKNNASQLTIYGLFRLQEGLNERELCVFFRNNHFSTMFKFEGELYLLVTDQGYLNQPDLVWEKLNEVNGDTVFMTGNFKEFRMENQSDSWSQQNAMTNTADYLAALKGSASEGSTLSSDLQLAIALQEQEFDRQPVCPEPQNSRPVSRSRLITGPQVPPRSVPATKPESKSKDKCVVM